ncbi:MAG: hypothetical protein AB2417_04050 [Clostridiaceae bacterium]
MLKFGVQLLFVTFTQMIIVIISKQFFSRLGGYNEPLIYLIIFIELVISIYFIHIGYIKEERK